MMKIVKQVTGAEDVTVVKNIGLTDARLEANRAVRGNIHYIRIEDEGTIVFEFTGGIIQEMDKHYFNGFVIAPTSRHFKVNNMVTGNECLMKEVNLSGGFLVDMDFVNVKENEIDVNANSVYDNLVLNNMENLIAEPSDKELFTTEELYYNMEVNAPIWNEERREVEGGIKKVEVEQIVSEDEITKLATNPPEFIEEESMENLITLKGTDRTVEVFGFDEYELLGYEVLNALNENYILEQLESNGEIDVEVIGNIYTVNGAEYLAIEGEDSATDRAEEYNVEVLEDCGISDDLLFEAELRGLIDTDYFENMWDELHQNMAYEEGIEYIATDEQLEQLECNEIEEDEIRDEYYNMLQEEITGSEIDEYISQFGREEFNKLVIEKDLIDLRALAKYIVDVDGRGYLASYDGEEIQEGELFLYRIN